VPNVDGIIISDPAVGARREHGLTNNGREQARRAGRQLLQMLSRETAADEDQNKLTEKFFPTIDAPCPCVTVVSSDFSRALETAECIRETLVGLDAQLMVDVALRERFFGSHEGKSNRHYEDVWRADQLDQDHTEEGVESCTSVQGRTTSLVARLEDDLSLPNQVIVLVSHGDALQILQTGFQKLEPGQHRRLVHLGNCEVRGVALI